MARPCSICNHPNRAEIDAALVSGTAFRNVAEQFSGISVTALHRHRASHIAEAVAAAQQAHHEAQVSLSADSITGQLDALRQRALSLLNQAEQNNDGKIALGAIREAVRILEILARIAGELRDAAPVVNVGIIASGEWTVIRGRVMSALAPYPEARDAVAVALLGHGPS